MSSKSLRRGGEAIGPVQLWTAKAKGRKPSNDPAHLLYLYPPFRLAKVSLRDRYDYHGQVMGGVPRVYIAEQVGQKHCKVLPANKRKSIRSETESRMHPCGREYRQTKQG